MLRIVMETSTATTEAETLEARIERLEPERAKLTSRDLSDTRRETLAVAHAAGVDDRTFVTIAAELRVSRKSTIVLPAHRLEGMSRGRGWARKGRGSSAVWGERVDGGYQVGPGRWIVGGHDGFSRKGQTEWTVEHVRVGGEIWTVAS